MEEELRARCRRFLAAHATGNPEPGPADPRGDRAMAVARAFQQALAAAGLAGLSLPVELGGQGLGPEAERVWREEAAAFPYMLEPLAVSLGNCLPLVLHHGTPAQRARWVAPLVSGAAVACQLFSEPDAGSDLANVQARAVPDGDGWRIRGQKVWTTYAHLADVGVLLARTDDALDRHDGLSMFLVDMHLPGVEVRPIHQIDGARLFDEVFLDDVHVGPDALVPPRGCGWTLAVQMLHHQRIARGTSAAGDVRHDRTDDLAALARAHDRLPDPTFRHALADLALHEVARTATAVRVRTDLEAGRPAGPGGSLAKLLTSGFAPRAADLAARVVGMAAVAWEDDDGVAREVAHARQFSIAGGTSEIQRTIVGERVLGLPKEPVVHAR